MEKNSIVIGLIGGMGSGKTEVAKLLEHNWHASILLADPIGHSILKKGHRAYKMIVKNFGTKILNSSGEIERRILGNIVFSDPDQLKLLNSITHPIMYKIIQDRIEEMKKDGHALIVLEAAVMIEAKFTDFIDSLWLVKCDQEKRIRRLIQGRNMEKETILQRISKQPTDEEFIQYVDVIIDNSFTIEETKLQVSQELNKLTKNILGGNL